MNEHNHIPKHWSCGEHRRRETHVYILSMSIILTVLIRHATLESTARLSDETKYRNRVFFKNKTLLMNDVGKTVTS